jgi:hypothetical protein
MGWSGVAVKRPLWGTSRYGWLWPKAPVDGLRLNDRSRIADAQAIPMDIA